MLRDKYDVQEFVEENDIKFIRLQFLDINGKLQNIAITSNQLMKAFDEGISFDASSVKGFLNIEKSDLLLFPDAGTAKILPWRPQQGRVARFICDIKYSDGTPFEGDSRLILKKLSKKCKNMGYDFQVGSECEFFLFKTDAQGAPTTIPLDNAGYCDVAPLDMGENTRREVCLTLEDMGFVIESSHHESASGQHEIDFRYSDVMTAADNLTTFKTVVKTIAQRNGLYASFMPKPLMNKSGSGLHINMSLFKDGINVFADEDNQITDLAKKFMAGILNHIKAICAFSNPLVNSYKRLVAGYEAPVHISWSNLNRSTLIRVPACTSRDSKRIELRNPDPACNHYLTLALILAAGMDGIEKDMQLSPSLEANAYNLSDGTLDKLPDNLYHAIEYMRNSEFIRNTLGDHIVDKYIEIKLAEWYDYNRNVSEWEINRYLSTF
ncbi:MAG TPA: type I glutamate--ammonia ligase [Ruminococcaceae bacterium]|nr:type I glutamate--ammonia ligase [Oscillospiraceae bacterium]